MAKYRTALPQLGKDIFVCYTGMETDLIFNRGIDLPGFASYPLLETKEDRETLHEYYGKLIDMAGEKSVGVILESVTWVANRDLGSAIGYIPEALRELNLVADRNRSDQRLYCLLRGRSHRHGSCRAAV